VLLFLICITSVGHLWHSPFKSCKV